MAAEIFFGNRMKKCSKIVFIYFISMLFLYLFFVPHIHSSSEVNVLVIGTWGLKPFKDPFKERYTAVDYLPPGTIIFETLNSELLGYSNIQTHFGHRLLIKDEIESSSSETPVKIYRSIEGLVDPPPTNALILHESILCLGQSNRIVTPPGKCKKFGHHAMSILPVGKGWIYKFSESTIGKWLQLNVDFNEKTKAELERRGLVPGEANFKITKNELYDLEKQGYLTMLNKNHPLVIFEYLNDDPLYIKCGQKKVTKKSLEVFIKATAKSEIEAEIPIWMKLLSGIKASLGIGLEGGAEATTGTSYEITVDTTEKSYLYYAARMTDTQTKSVSNILIKKIFECNSSPDIGPGDRILSVEFEIESPHETDLPKYKFINADEYLKIPDRICNLSPRPIFLSLNSPKQHSDVLKKIVQEWKVDVNFAHFIISNLNYTCPSRNRELCKELIDENNR